jgi:cell division initiation protein
MAYTPVEIRHVKPQRSLFGYRRNGVDRLLSEIADSFEHVWRERADFADRIEHLESEVMRHRELEGLLRTTLVSAEKAAHELKDQAAREADRISAEAYAEAREITRAARAERERLVLEARRIRLLLHSALDALDEDDFDETEGADEEDTEGEAEAA